MELKIIITIVTIAAAIGGFGIAALCYVYFCQKICKDKGKKGGSVSSVKLPNGGAGGYPKVPLFKAAARDVQIVQMMQKDQYSRYADLTKPQRKLSVQDLNHESDVFAEGKTRRKDGYRKLDRAKSQQHFFFDESPTSPLSSDDAITCTQNYYPQADSMKAPSRVSEKNTTPLPERREHRPKFPTRRVRRSLSTAEIPSDLTALMKNRYKSESDIPGFTELDNRSNSSSHSNNSATALSVLSPADGQLDFRLFFNSDTKCFDVTVTRLIDVAIKAADFMGVLETVRHDSHEKPKAKVYLKEHDDRSVELVSPGKPGYLIYVSIPEIGFKRHTNVMYGSTSVVFNEVFSLHNYGVEELNQLVLCLHVLAQLGIDVEPIIVGEVKVPLQVLQANHVMPFLTEMTAPQFELELEQSPLKEATLGELQMVISYNPMISQLGVRLVQATGLPKISMTGHPNVSVKTSLYYGGGRLGKQSTSIHKRQKEPVFNETFHFDISKDRIMDCDLLFEIRHHGPMHRTVIGYVTVGKTAAGTGANHWRQLLDYSHFEKAHRITPNKPAGLG